MGKVDRSLIKRYSGNPVLSAKDVPFSSTLVCNAGVVKYKGRYITLFRNDYGDFRGGGGWNDTCGRNLGLAYSDDGMHWKVEPKPVWDLTNEKIHDAYDPRITVIDDRFYVCFASDDAHGIRGGIAVTDDFSKFEILSLTVPDNRNMVLFPEKIDGKFARLERPFPVYGHYGRGPSERFDIWYGDSSDAKYWGNFNLVLGGEKVPYCNSKIGPSAPPIKTDKGWLAFFHSTFIDPSKPLKGWEKKPWTKRYDAGLILLDLKEPWKLIGMSTEPVLIAEEEYEVNGYRGSVIFPTGLIDEGNGEVKVYYGAADTVFCMATAKITDLLSMIEPVR